MQVQSSTHSPLQSKLAEMESKMKMITASYMKLKELIKEKDQQILQLRNENQRIVFLHEAKQNPLMMQLRKKYETESYTEKKMYTEGVPVKKVEGESHQYKKNDISKESFISPIHSRNPSSIRMAKSLSPDFKNSMNFIALNMKPYFKTQQSNNTEQIPKSIKQIGTVFSRHKDRSQQFFFDDLEKSTIKEKALNMSVSETLKQKTSNVSEAQSKIKQDGKNQQTEAIILHELWEERDRQIRRMDELFDSLNQRINKPLT